MKNGINLRHVSQRYIMLCVSMRPIKNSLIEKTISITSKFPQVRYGNPKQIGIHGEFVPIKENETPVFLACGVTGIEAMINFKISEILAQTLFFARIGLNTV